MGAGEWGARVATVPEEVGPPPERGGRGRAHRRPDWAEASAEGPRGRKQDGGECESAAGHGPHGNEITERLKQVDTRGR